MIILKCVNILFIAYAVRCSHQILRGNSCHNKMTGINQMNWIVRLSHDSIAKHEAQLFFHTQLILMVIISVVTELVACLYSAWWFLALWVSFLSLMNWVASQFEALFLIVGFENGFVFVFAFVFLRIKYWDNTFNCTLNCTCLCCTSDGDKKSEWTTLFTFEINRLRS